MIEIIVLEECKHDSLKSLWVQLEGFLFSSYDFEYRYGVSSNIIEVGALGDLIKFDCELVSKNLIKAFKLRMCENVLLRIVS